MRKYIPVVVIVILLLIAGWYFYTNSKQSAVPSSNPANTEQSIGDKMTGKISDLINAGKSLQCTYSSKVDNYNSEGTIYVSSGKVRGDFQSESAGKMMDSHMIQSGDTMYTWTTDPKQGMMIKINKEEMNKYKNDPKYNNQSFNLDQSYDYNCSNWGVDPSKFEKPSDIVFTDLSAQMEQIKNLKTEDGGSACSACDQIPDEDSKASCQKSLGC